MRVIAGRFKGQPLAGPTGDHTRPVTDRVKESLFSLVTHRLSTPGFMDGLAVLDVFAGCGSFGIECLSRGARCCAFVEHDRRTLPVLRSNIARLKLADGVAVVQPLNAWTMRVAPPDDADGWDLVFVDPPYRDVNDSDRMLDLLERLAARLARDGLIVFRREHGRPFPEHQLRTLRRVDEREWGRMVVALLKRLDAPEPADGQPGTGRV